ncbi:MAG: hypothetical protein LBV69_10025 [Bacteroidales bacterium]|jgi:hypothetical protein|nr:hypothetical protein [Bacteroidales bacterium]
MKLKKLNKKEINCISKNQLANIYGGESVTQITCITRTDANLEYPCGDTKTTCTYDGAKADQPATYDTKEIPCYV